MMNELKKSKFFCLFTVLFGIALDQLTKYLVSHLMTLGQSIPLIPGVIHLTYITNDGAAFGMLDDKRWVFLVLSSVVILFLIGYLVTTKATSRLFLFSLSLILSGGIGNMIDRVFLGEVIDFIDFTLIHFAIFNGADSFVCVGAFLLFFYILFDKKAGVLADAGEKDIAAAMGGAESAEPPEPTNDAPQNRDFPGDRAQDDAPQNRDFPGDRVQDDAPQNRDAPGDRAQDDPSGNGRSAGNDHAVSGH